MFIYQVSTGCYSDKYHKVLANNKKFSKEEFVKILKDTVQGLIRKDDFYTSLDEVCDELKKIGFFEPRMEAIHLWDYSSDDVLENKDNFR